MFFFAFLTMSKRLIQEKMYEIYQLAKQSKDDLNKNCSTGSEIQDTSNRMEKIMQYAEEIIALVKQAAKEKM